MSCQYKDKTAKTAPAPLTTVELPDGPWEKVAIDITGPFERATWDCRYAIALTEYYSKWPEVAFVSTVTTEVIIRFLTSVFSCEENPSYHAFATFLREREIKHLHSSV